MYTNYARKPTLLSLSTDAGGRLLTPAPWWLHADVAAGQHLGEEEPEAEAIVLVGSKVDERV